jgi:DNA invertase Pin-like site-specific DNA recombinase
MTTRKKQTAPATRRKRAVIYVRQSTFREESISLDLQVDQCEQYAQRLDYDVIKTITDAGISGLELNKRPGIQEALHLIETHQATVILIYSWSRLSRHGLHQAQLLDRIETAGGTVESATEPFDTSTPTGEFGRDVMLNHAKLDSKIRSKQWREGMAFRVHELGLLGGGIVPFGYQYSGRYEPVRIHKTYGPILAQLYRDYISGQGPQRLVHGLNDAGHRTPRGKMFSVSAVERMLDSGFAAGLLNVHDPECAPNRKPRGDHVRKCKRRVMVKGQHEAVIDAETWETYQRERNRRRLIKSTKARHPRWWLGGGLTICGQCGRGLIITRYKSGASQAKCARYHSQRSCPGVWISRETIERAVTIWMEEFLVQILEQRDSLSANDERAQLLKEQAALRSAITNLDDGQAKVRSLVAHNLATVDEFRSAMAENDRERRALQAKVDDLQAQLDLLEPGEDYLTWLLERHDDFIDAPPDETNALLKKVIKKIAITRETLTIEHYLGDPWIWSRVTGEWVA